jgi:hypothetical protein
MAATSFKGWSSAPNARRVAPDHRTQLLAHGRSLIVFALEALLELVELTEAEHGHREALRIAAAVASELVAAEEAIEESAS